jgi:hypothetical protein
MALLLYCSLKEEKYEPGDNAAIKDDISQYTKISQSTTFTRPPSPQNITNRRLAFESSQG